ncbi:MAG: hypothetical protein ACI8WM_002113 [Burkholderiaceae bacterium]|jgi:hypothetical protein
MIVPGGGQAGAADIRLRNAQTVPIAAAMEVIVKKEIASTAAEKKAGDQPDVYQDQPAETGSAARYRRS